jgi:hypothetical protein
MPRRGGRTPGFGPPGALSGHQEPRMATSTRSKVDPRDAEGTHQDGSLGGWVGAFGSIWASRRQVIE